MLFLSSCSKTSVVVLSVMEKGRSSCSRKSTNRTSPDASFPTGAGVTPVFSYTVMCRGKKCRCTSAPLVQVINTSPAPCRVLSSRKRSLSAPLSNFVYDFTQKAFSNREGYTWTPMYLQHCTSLSVLEQVIDQDFDHDCYHPKSIASVKVPLFASTSWITSKCQDQECYNPHGIKQLTSYSKFMESPYLSKRMSSKKLVRQQSMYIRTLTLQPSN